MFQCNTEMIFYKINNSMKFKSTKYNVTSQAFHLPQKIKLIINRTIVKNKYDR